MYSKNKSSYNEYYFEPDIVFKEPECRSLQIECQDPMSDSKQVHISAAQYPAISRFKPGLDECLSVHYCLPYFIQYLEYCKSIRLLHFLFACESFRKVAANDQPDFSFPNSPTRTIKSGLQHDALDIYVKFVSMNAPHSISLPENTRQSIENQISTEDGKVDARCFDDAVEHVRTVLSESFVPKFHRSSYCTAYLLEVLRKDMCLADVLLSDSSITFFMEFLEQRRQENHVLFWVSVQAFQEHLKRINDGLGSDMKDIGADAIALYDTYLSLQARKPVNYGRIIRGIVESCISPDDGIISTDAFQISQQYCYHYMDKFFFESYTKSDQFKRFGKEQTLQLASRRKAEHTIRLNSTASRIPNQEIVQKIGAMSINSSSPPSSPRKTPSTSLEASHAKLQNPSLETSNISVDIRTPSSSYRSSPTSSKTSSPQSNKRSSELSPKSLTDEDTVSNGQKNVDILDDSNFWSIPDSDYTMSAMDEWGVYKSQDKHLLNSPPQGSEKLKKSVMKFFGKEEITDEDAVAQAKNIVADVMNLSAKPLDLNDLLSQDDM